MRTIRLLTATLALTIAASACGSDAKSSTTTTSNGGSPSRAPTGTVTVLAASSLTKAFTALGNQFEASHRGTKIAFSFGSSSDLETQIEQGAPADVFASADTKNMDKVVAAQANAGSPVPFAKNELEIAVEPDNPMKVAGLSDLAASKLVVVLCDPSAPCGKFADQVLANAKVTVNPKSREATAKATLSKVELGEADAAIVYASDVATSGKVDGVKIPADVNVITTLPIVTLRDAKNVSLAKAWVEFVNAHRADLVTEFGFLPL